MRSSAASARRPEPDVCRRSITEREGFRHDWSADGSRGPERRLSAERTSRWSLVGQFLPRGACARCRLPRRGDAGRGPGSRYRRWRRARRSSAGTRIGCPLTWERCCHHRSTEPARARRQPRRRLASPAARPPSPKPDRSSCFQDRARLAPRRCCRPYTSVWSGAEICTARWGSSSANAQTTSRGRVLHVHHGPEPHRRHRADAHAGCSRAWQR